MDSRNDYAREYSDEEQELAAYLEDLISGVLARRAMEMFSRPSDPAAPHRFAQQASSGIVPAVDAPDEVETRDDAPDADVPVLQPPPKSGRSSMRSELMELFRRTERTSVREAGSALKEVPRNRRGPRGRHSAGKRVSAAVPRAVVGAGGAVEHRHRRTRHHPHRRAGAWPPPGRGTARRRQDRLPGVHAVGRHLLQAPGRLLSPEGWLSDRLDAPHQHPGRHPGWTPGVSRRTAQPCVATRGASNCCAPSTTGCSSRCCLCSR